MGNKRPELGIFHSSILLIPRSTQYVTATEIVKREKVVDYRPAVRNVIRRNVSYIPL